MSTIAEEIEELAASSMVEYILETGPAASGYYCKHCYALMLATTTPAGEPVLMCDNPVCGWTISAAESVVAEVFSQDSRLAKIVKLMATTGASYDLAAAAIAEVTR